MARKTGTLTCLLLIFLLSITVVLGGCAAPREELSSTERNELPVQSKAVSPVPNTEPAGSSEDILKLHYVDVGQGDAILLQCPGGENILVDGGDKVQGEVLCAYLRECGIQELAAIVGTHPHADHIGGLIKVVQEFPVKAVYMPRVTHSSDTFRDLLLAIKNKGLKISTAKAGVELPLQAIKAQFIAPRTDHYEDLNNYSAVLKIDYGAKSFLLMGDAEKESEEQILSSGLNIKADVLKLGHHGSASSSGEDFIEAVAPSWAVIMCAPNNDYGHPHRETLQVLGKYGAELLRTDEDGTLIITSDGQKIEVYKKGKKKASAGLSPVPVPATVQGEEGVFYIGNLKSRVFHRPDCSNLPASKNQIRLPSREEALEKGYRPCKNCQP
jgi:competence protein ComEC